MGPDAAGPVSLLEFEDPNRAIELYMALGLVRLQ